MNGGHILAIGASGMLSSACLELAQRGHRVSLLARNEKRLQQLAGEASELPGSILPLPLDYTDDIALANALQQRLDAEGRPEFILSWIHSHAVHAPLTLARLAGDEKRPVPFFGLRGSMADLAGIDSRDMQLRNCAGISLHIVQLGRIRLVGSWRWLSDEEISRGCLAAIDATQPFYLVGEDLSPAE